MAPSALLSSAQQTSIPLLAGLALHLAKGFGKPSPSSPSSADRTERQRRKSERSLRGKLIPCKPCRGRGQMICKFCEGTTRMKGFLGQRVPCIPCEATGLLGRACPVCNGAGYTQS